MQAKPLIHNRVWQHPDAIVAYDRETGYERPFIRYAFKRVGDDPKVVHIGAVQTDNASMASIEIMNRIGYPAMSYGTMTFAVLSDAMGWKGGKR